MAIAVTLLTAVHFGHREIVTAALRTTFPAHECVATGLGVAIPIQPGLDGDDY